MLNLGYTNDMHTFEHMNITLQSPHKFGKPQEGIYHSQWPGGWIPYGGLDFDGITCSLDRKSRQHRDVTAVACPSQIVTRSFVAPSLWMRKARRLDCKLKFFAMQYLNVTVYCLVFSCWMWIRRADKSHYRTLKNVQEATRNNNGNFWKSWLYQGSQNFSVTCLSLLWSKTTSADVNLLMGDIKNLTFFLRFPKWVENNH